MRVEDLDGPRVKPEAEREALETLRWLGLDWDGDLLRQSDDLDPYIDAMRTLASKRCVFPSALSRKEIEAAASAPHADEIRHETRFPPELRPDVIPTTFDDEGENWRLIVEDEEVRFEDALCGAQSFRPFSNIGDLVVWTKRGQPSYQLAVVVDDERQGVTRIVRGDDLLDSTARQILIRRALGMSHELRHLHLPLVVGEDGRRLAKRHGDTRLTAYRARGVRPERVVGLLASWCGLERTETSAREFASAFDADTMTREEIVFTSEDHAWLVS